MARLVEACLHKVSNSIFVAYYTYALYNRHLQRNVLYRHLQRMRAQPRFKKQVF